MISEDEPFGLARAVPAGVIHPFAHMNATYAAAQVRARGVALPAVEPFAQALTRAPKREMRLEALTEEPAVGDPPAPPPALPPSAPRSSVPHFLEVAESLRHPNGPYRQAPAEHGGEWWLVTPFTGLEPWLTQGIADPYAPPPPTEPENLDPAFLAVFGPRPTRESHPNPLLRGAAVADWERNRACFKGTGVPEGFTQAQVDAAGALFEAWGMGRPLFYEGRYGWTAVFPQAAGQGFEASPFTALEAPHLVVARYQIERSAAGEQPAERHPFVPPQVFERGYFEA